MKFNESILSHLYKFSKFFFFTKKQGPSECSGPCLQTNKSIGYCMELSLAAS